MLSNLYKLVIELISKCNEYCVHCYIPNSRRKFTLEFKSLKSVFDQARKNKVTVIEITGGEVFLHPEFTQILNYANDCGFILRIYSNLIVLSSEHFSLLSKINLQRIQTSVYSLNPAIHDAVTRKKGSLYRTMKHILLLKNANIPIEISCPVMTINKDEFLNVHDWAIKRNFKFHTDFSIIGTQDLSGSNLKYRLSIEEEIKLQSKLYERSPWAKKTFMSPSSSDKIYSENMDTLAISAEGNYVPNVLRADKILGDIWNNKLDDIWMNSTFLNFLRNLEYSQFPDCLKCEAIEYCAKCYDVHYFETGNFFKQSKRLCDSIKLTNQIVNYYQTKTL